MQRAGRQCGSTSHLGSAQFRLGGQAAGRQAVRQRSIPGGLPSASRLGPCCAACWRVRSRHKGARGQAVAAGMRKECESVERGGGEGMGGMGGMGDGGGRDAGLRDTLNQESTPVLNSRVVRKSKPEAPCLFAGSPPSLRRGSTPHEPSPSPLRMYTALSYRALAFSPQDVCIRPSPTEPALV